MKQNFNPGYFDFEDFATWLQSSFSNVALCLINSYRAYCAKYDITCAESDRDCLDESIKYLSVYNPRIFDLLTHAYMLDDSVDVSATKFF